MEPVVDICCICLRYDVKYYQLNDAIQPPTDLYFQGCVEFRSLIQKILLPNILQKLDGNGKLLKSVICRGCHDGFRRMYWFMHQCVESENTLSQLKEVNIKIKKLKTISMIINIKEEIDEFFENEDANKWNSCWMTDNITHEDSTSDCMSLFEIEKCDDNIQDTNALKSVVKETVAETNSIKLSCNMCTKKFASSLGLKLHMKRIHQTVLKYECDKCFAAYKDLHSLKAHKKTHRKTCKKCKHKFTSLKRHRQDYHSGRTYECNVCDAKFQGWIPLRKHKSNHKPKYKCDQCNAEYKLKNTLRQHLLLQTGVSYICKICHESFSTKCKFSQHRLTHLNRKYACDQCDAKYSDRYGLKKHKKVIHLKLKERFQCDECNAEFGSRAGLDYHRQSHAGFMYECDQCDEKFKSKRGINNHKVSHTGLKCDLCHAHFPSEGIIKRLVENSLIRNLTCIQCNTKNARNVSTE